MDTQRRVRGGLPHAQAYFGDRKRRRAAIALRNAGERDRHVRFLCDRVQWRRLPCAGAIPARFDESSAIDSDRERIRAVGRQQLTPDSK